MSIFNVCDIFFGIIVCDIGSYAEDNTPNNFDFNLDHVISNLETSTNSLLNWFRENHMKASADKFHLIVSSDESFTAKIKGFSIKNSTEEKLLGLKFDSNVLKIMSPLFVKRPTRNYTLLQECHIKWT